MLTDATLSKAQAHNVAAVAHDGLARAVTPVHSMLDGDTIFCLASARTPLDGLAAFDDLLQAAAETFTAACLDAVLSAEGRGGVRSYVELAPSTLPYEIAGER